MTDFFPLLNPSHIFKIDHDAKNRDVCASLNAATHQADPPDSGLAHGTLPHLGGLLTEEEVELVVVLLGAVRDEVCVDECRI